MKTIQKPEVNEKSRGLEIPSQNEAPLCLPEGALDMLVALSTPNPRGGWGIPVLLWGPPGSGKTSFVESLAQDKFPVYTLIASLHDPTDFNGMPYFREGRTVFLPPEWVDIFKEAQKGILFLDELTTAPPAVQSALLRLVLERQVGSYRLPAGVRIVAAANPVDQIIGGWEPSPALANRFLHLHWKMDARIYAQGLRYGFGGVTLANPEIQPKIHQERLNVWKKKLADFLERHPDYFYLPPEEGEYAYPTARTWDYALHLLATCELLDLLPDFEKFNKAPENPGIVFRILRGVVGSGAAIAFLHFLKVPNIHLPENLLDGKEKLSLPLNPDELSITFEGMLRLLKRPKRRNQTFGDRLKRFLQIAIEVADKGQGDVIFPYLHDLVASGWLMEAVSTQHLELLKGLGNYFGEFKEFAEQVSGRFEEKLIHEIFRASKRI